MSQGKLGELLADDLGAPISQTTISNWEGGEGVVPYTVLMAASRLLGKRLGRAVTVEEFVTGDFDFKRS
jgi:transcriptional regulator with XRE-family HTH domain